VGADSGCVERCAGESDIDEAGPQTRGRVGEVGFADTDVDCGVTLAKGGGEAGTGLFGAVGEAPMVMVAVPAAAPTRARTCSACSSSVRASS